ncbi:COG4280 domain-containing protein [Capilliphycus salinus ALCB114379]|uniref:COG4280 domain-containing protein n=1 Tax=Capilliphycus salinus TaxID=2768948 RepID=UPI0039A612FC
MNWSIFLAAAGSASVEFLETAAIAYAIARSGYRREAIWGTVAGLTVVAVAAIALGSSLQLIPLYLLQIIIGSLLVWFGWGWVKKSVLRQAKGKRAGWMSDDPLEAEGILIETEPENFSPLNFMIMAKSAALEGLEVAIIVTTLGLASAAWKEAISATFLALVFSIGLVTLLHQYLLKLPEVLIKLGAGILLMALGTFWLGEGLNFEWPFEEFAILILVSLYSLAATVAIYILKKSQTISETKVPG